MVTHAKLAQYPKELASHKGKERAYTDNVHSVFFFAGVSSTIAWQE